MKIKNVGILLFNLAAVSMLTLGFSSWVFGQPDPSFNVNVSAEDVKEVSFLRIPTNGIKMFSLGPDGLVQDNTIVNTSSIEISLLVDNALAVPFLNSGNLNFELILSCSEQSFISEYISSPTVNNAVSLSSQIINFELKTNVSYPITNETGTTRIIANYVITDKPDQNGKLMAALYYANKPSFTFKVRGN